MEGRQGPGVGRPLACSAFLRTMAHLPASGAPSVHITCATRRLYIVTDVRLPGLAPRVWACCQCRSGLIYFTFILMIHSLFGEAPPALFRGAVVLYSPGPVVGAGSYLRSV